MWTSSPTRASILRFACASLPKPDSCEGRTDLPGGHIRDAISDIKAYASAGEEAFRADRMRQDAIIRKLEVIGEAVKRISEPTRALRPEIPWKQIAGMRDRLTHAYFGVDLDLVWRVVDRDFQGLETAVAALIEASAISE